MGRAQGAVRHRVLRARSGQPRGGRPRPCEQHGGVPRGAEDSRRRADRDPQGRREDRRGDRGLELQVPRPLRQEQAQEKAPRLQPRRRPDPRGHRGVLRGEAARA